PRSVETLVDTIIYAAEDMGYFAENGLTVTVEEATGTDTQMVAVGQYDFAVPAPSAILAAIEAGLPIIAVEQYGAWNIFGFSALTNAGINTWEDLNGKTIALGDASWEALAQPLLDAAGVKDIEYIVAGENRYVQVEAGKIDALFTWLDEIYLLQAQGYDFNYIDGNEVLKNSANSFICSLDSYANRKDIVQGFVKGIQMGTYFVAQNPEAAADIVLNRFPALASTVDWDGAVAVQKSLKIQSYGVTEEDFQSMSNPTGLFFEDKWNLNQEACVTSGIISETIDPAKVYTNEFVLNGMNDEDKVRVAEDAANYTFTSELAKEAGK
ncbi:MAG: ABC transporter substrate-binding protein, partial [Clostridiaceae bacterium]|nr:ABC transporter substrate-binding protein [Clostridiaceae bacterium]